jgi:hypothetical protein
MLQKNVASQGVYLFSVDTTTTPYSGKTGDASNITGAWSKDGGAETAGFTTAHPTEIGGGVYWQPLSQGETNGNRLSYRWSSSTTGISINPAIVETTGVNFPAGGTVAASVWDEVNTAATHNVNNSAGKQLRLLTVNTGVIYTATAPSQAGMTSTQIKLDAGASAADNAYQYDVVSIISGTDAGDSRIITGYVGSTKVATVDSVWTVQPDATSVFEITPTAKAQVVGTVVLTNPPGIRKNVALSHFTFPMISSSDHVSRVTGATVTVTLSLDGGSFGASTNSPAEIGTTGNYQINLAAADLNAGVICFKATATGCDDTELTIVTQP